jgi:hypothetical protein
MSVRGWVYVLTNKAMPGLVKIGFSTKDPFLRAQELEGTGLPHPYVVEYDVLVIEPRDVEQAVHTQLRAHNESKEFFRAEVIAAVNAIREVIASQEKSIIAESRFEPIAAAHSVANANADAEEASRTVLCPSCGTENKVFGNQFVCHRCRNYHSASRGDDDQMKIASRHRIYPADVRSGIQQKPALNPAADWPLRTGSREDGSEQKTALNPAAAWPFPNKSRP